MSERPHNAYRGNQPPPRRGDRKQSKLAHVDERISAHRTKPNQPDRTTWLVRLAELLEARFSLTESMDDLHKAITGWNDALGVVPKEDSRRKYMAEDFGVLLMTRFEEMNSASDLDSAINWFDRSAKAFPKDDPDRVDPLNNLYDAVQIRYSRNETIAEVDKMIGAMQGVIDIIPEGKRGWSVALDRLGIGWVRRFDLSKTPTDLTKGIEFIESAIASTTSDKRREEYQQHLELARRLLPQRANAYSRRLD
jgi:hypothetical protein